MIDQRTAAESPFRACASTPRRWVPVCLASIGVLSMAAAALAQPRVIGITADNRGQVILEFDRDMQSLGLQNAQAISVSGAGPDGISGTEDDQAVSTSATLDSVGRRLLTVRANINPDERYSFLLRSEFALDLQGNELDGEFNGQDSPSGNGDEGGDLEFFTRFPEGNPIARIVTSVGTIDVELFQNQTPLTVQNFFDYANDGVWDETFVHRLVPSFVWQAGGYNSRTFQRIPQNAPVLNEPGISNTRGTIAMAKLSNNPNSATNEWFFNLTNNSANLDQQNGGFTVFGEVINSDGLAIMDEIAGLPTINASQINGAFGDLPVLDDDKFLDEEGQPIEDPDVSGADLVSISRISILFEAIDRPFNNIDVSQSATIFGPEGSTARVSLFNLDGGPITLPEGIVDVQFGGGNSINRITFREPFSPNLIGVQIRGATSVGTINDTRNPSNNRLAFILCDAPVNNIVLQSLSGFDINQTRLPDGTILPADIDGDGRTDDPTALILTQGLVNQVRIGGDLGGSVIAEQGLRTVRVDGQTSDCSFVIDGPTNIAPNFVLGRVRDSRIDAPNNLIAGIRAIDWIGEPDQRIDARGVRTIRITGRSNQNISGDFHPSLFLSGLPTGGTTLAAAVINGDVRDATWDINGAVSNINIRNAASRWNFRVLNGNINSINAGRLAATNIINNRLIGRILTGEWNAGTLQPSSLRSLIVRPNPKAQATGTFEANISFQPPAIQPFAIGVLDFRGPIRNAQITIPASHNAQAVIFRDTVDDSSFSFNGSIRNFQALGVLRDITINIPNTENIIVGRWIGGALNAGNSNVRTLRTVGYRGEPGDLFADVTARSIESTVLARGGSYKGTFDVDIPVSVVIQGDVIDSLFRLGGNNFRFSTVNQRILVGGDIRTTRMQATGAIGQIRSSGLIDSQILSGPPQTINNIQTIPDSNPGLFTVDRIAAVQVVGNNAVVANSFVVAGEIGAVSLRGIMTSNVGNPFGVAAGNLNGFNIQTDTGLTRFFNGTLQDPKAWGDFQLRPQFQIPTGQSP